MPSFSALSAPMMSARVLPLESAWAAPIARLQKVTSRSSALEFLAAAAAGAALALPSAAPPED
eukprot:12729352-Alexandrium_andersonii.AAC.1